MVSTIAGVLDSLEIHYAIMGGAAVCLITGDPNRRTKDIDLVIQVDGRSITADKLTHHLLASFPDHFGPVNQFGHVIPGYKLTLPGGTLHLVDLEVFDHQSWPQRPQYDLQATTVMTMHVNERQVKIFNPAWLLREKILAQAWTSKLSKGTDGCYGSEVIGYLRFLGPTRAEFRQRTSQERSRERS